ncbi:hypothetical protein V6N13_096719 [Hibiscus sabdariffa]
MREPRYPLPRVVLCIHDKVGTSPSHTHRERGCDNRRPPFSFRFLGVIHAGGCLFCHGDTGFDNDPSAGSPTETLLRLLLPLNDKVQWTSRDVAGSEPPTSPRSEHFHRTIQSVGATGGVYKGQGRSQRELMTPRLLGIPREDQQLQ